MYSRNMPRVLITKNITNKHLQHIVEADLEFQIETAVRFDIDYKPNVVIQKIKEKSDWLFTSINAVKAIQSLLIRYQNKFEQKIYCVGKKTFNLLSQLGFYSVKFFENETDFVENNDFSKTERLTYFCNNNRKDIIPKLQKNDLLELNYVEVFKVTMLRPKIQKSDFDFIFYFSPLGAKSILAKNPHLSSIKSICSGPATKRILEQNGVENCYIPDQPSLKTMVEFIQNHEKLG